MFTKLKFKFQDFKKISQKFNFRYFSKTKTSNNTIAETAVTTYSKPLQWFHWIQGFCFTGIALSGYVASNISSDPNVSSTSELEKKSNLMHAHKTMGLIMLGKLLIN
jgi:Ni,Fe-hydrogenase I cytochrome b subunit